MIYSTMIGMFTQFTAYMDRSGYVIARLIYKQINPHHLNPCTAVPALIKYSYIQLPAFLSEAHLFPLLT